MRYFVNRLFIVVLLLYNVSSAFTQDFKSIRLSKQDRKNGVSKKYEYAGATHFSSLIILYGNHNYRYEENYLTTTLFNEGTWRQINGQLILKDKIDKDSIPITLQYLNKTDSTSDFIIQIIKNRKGESLTDGFVYINNDSNQCLPLTGTCLEKFDTVYRVKFVFENGYKSKWIEVDHQNYAQILPILQTDFSMYTYTQLRNTKYKIMKSCLKPLK